MRRAYQRLSLIIIASLFVAAVYELYTQSWSDLFVVTEAIVLSLVPYVLKRKYDIYTPEAVQLGIVFFLLATLFLGQVNQFYAHYYWWDVVLHSFAGVGSTVIAFILLVLSYRTSELRSTPFMTSLLAFSLTMTMAVLWEVYEFLIDLYWQPAVAMQEDNYDTMTDLLVTVIGGGLVALSGYRYLVTRGEKGAISSVIEEGRQNNLETVQHTSSSS